MTLDQALDLAAALCVFSGALLTMCSAVGLVRFPDTLSRMHPAAKPQVLGLLLVVSGALVRVWPGVDTGMLVLTGLVALCTAPVVANRLGNVAYREASSAGTETSEAGPAPRTGGGPASTAPDPSAPDTTESDTTDGTPGLPEH